MSFVRLSWLWMEDETRCRRLACCCLLIDIKIRWRGHEHWYQVSLTCERFGNHCSLCQHWDETGNDGRFAKRSQVNDTLDQCSWALHPVFTFLNDPGESLQWCRYISLMFLNWSKHYFVNRCMALIMTYHGTI